MPESNVRTIRPLNLTSDVVVRPRGPLDLCIVELQDAVGYVAARPGGAIVLDCTDLTLVSGGGAAAITSLLGEVRSNNRVSQLRHVSAQMQQELDRLADSDSDSGAEVEEAGDREGRPR